jgi:UDP-N-acetylglucosamine--dolichyl-phosphate N-acetylglucosaminephosphotransferase
VWDSALGQPSVAAQWVVSNFAWLGIGIDPGAAGALVDLGALYLVYMGFLAVFATNAINIYAGINGLEAGQSLVIAVAILTANLWELSQGAQQSSPHLFSALLAIPFIATTVGLLGFNMYPASVFVGDTYCYYAGMTFAVMGILGHFSKTLLLFFIPQIFNFLYSLPQLFKVYECPRHRMPDYDAASDTIRPSQFTMKKTTTSDAGKANDKRKTKPGKAEAEAATVVRRDNMTLINLTLRVLGPMHERTAVGALLALQVLCCAVGLFLRYGLGHVFYTGPGGAARRPTVQPPVQSGTSV